MKKNDFISAKNLSKEIERIMKEDQSILNNRRNERKKCLVNKFKVKQKQEIEHFKSSQETILVNLQSKWNDRLENERKLINTNDARQSKKITSKITNQKISVNALEPEGSAKSKLNPKTKTNAQLKVAIKNGIMKNIESMLNSKASEESQPSEKNYEFKKM